MSSTVDIASSFIEGTPPGRAVRCVNINDDVEGIDLRQDPALHLGKLKPAFERYNEEQLTAVKLPGSIQPVRLRNACHSCSCADVPRYLSANYNNSRMADTTILRATQVSSSTDITQVGVRLLSLNVSR